MLDVNGNKKETKEFHDKNVKSFFKETHLWDFMCDMAAELKMSLAEKLKNQPSTLPMTKAQQGSGNQ